jgi:methionyl-tRNA synthetase
MLYGTMKRRLITSALPYVNNVPHLGNLIQVLSADVFARFCRLRGYETLYVCGTDEYGTATETKALEEGVTPRELCDRFNAIHTEIYRWFEISFDKFGRTSTPQQTEITQGLFLDLERNGLIKRKTIEQLFCGSCQRFLADRYIVGTCPACGYDGARGDQCEHCGKLLDPTELKDPRCSTCGSTPSPRETKHLFIDLPALKPRLEEWMREASAKGFWARNAIQMTQAWIRDGLHERCITRDLKWGIPVPLAGYEDKVFYVWFDAPIGYISIAATHTPDWRSWWQSPEDVELFQFIGKDNIPFHTVIFPCTLLGSGGKWTMLHHMSSTEYLNYEGTKFSKSKGIGVFGTDARETGIPADVWRFYIYYNRPETSDAHFYWKDFQEKVNGELIGNLGNLVNRTLTFCSRYLGGAVPAAPKPGSPEAAESEAFWAEVREKEAAITANLEKADLRDAFREAFALSSIANKAFQDGEPWKARASAPEKAERLIRDLLYVIRDLAVIMRPFMPQSAEKLASFLGLSFSVLERDGEVPIDKAGGLDWSSLGRLEGLGAIGQAKILFERLEDEAIEAFRLKYSGSQRERAEKEAERIEGEKKPAPKPETKPEAAPSEPSRMQGEGDEDAFARLIELRVGRIEAIERHPKAEKLYVETIDLGAEKRTIVSGLVPYYMESELLGKHVIVAANLKAAKLRGVMSQGMLLAASMADPAAGLDEAGKPKTEIVEVLEAPWAEPGTRVALRGSLQGDARLPEIGIDCFFSVPIRAENGEVKVGAKALEAAGRAIITARVKDGEVG